MKNVDELSVDMILLAGTRDFVPRVSYTNKIYVCPRKQTSLNIKLS